MPRLKTETYASIRGFNYQPSYAANGVQSWLDMFDRDVFKREIECGKEYFPNINTLRIWLSHVAFVLNPDRNAANLEAVLRLHDVHQHGRRDPAGSWRFCPFQTGLTCVRKAISNSRRERCRAAARQQCNEEVKGGSS